MLRTWTRRLLHASQSRRRRRRQHSLRGLLGFQPLEPRHLLAGVTDSGTALQIDLDSGEQLNITPAGTTYEFNVAGFTFTNGGVANAADFSGFTTNTLTLEASGLARYDTIQITDSAADAKVLFTNSGGNAFSDSFHITLDDGARSASVQFANNGMISFAGATGITAVSDSNVLVQGALSTVDGDISLTGSSSDGNAIQVSHAGAISSSNGSITLTGATSSPNAGHHGVFTGGRPISTTGVGANITLTGTNSGTGQAVDLVDSTIQTGEGAIQIEGNNNDTLRDATLLNGATVTTTGATSAASISITGDNAGTASGRGLVVQSGSMVSTNAGNISLNGTSNGSHGMQLTTSGTLIESTAGNVEITATADTGTTNQNAVLVHNGAEIRGVDITIQAMNTGAGDGFVTSGGATLTAAGELSVAGSALGRGITLNKESVLTAGGLLTLDGTNFAGGGVFVTGSLTQITSTGAGMMITGTGLTGVNVLGGASVAANGPIAIMGTGSVADGVTIGAAADISTTSGGIHIVGTTHGDHRFGVEISSGSTVRSTETGAGAGAVRIEGVITGLAGAGLVVERNSASVTSVDADIVLVGAGASGVGIVVQVDSAVRATGSGDVSLVGDSGFVNAITLFSTNTEVSVAEGNLALTANTGDITLNGVVIGVAQGHLDIDAPTGVIDSFVATLDVPLGNVRLASGGGGTLLFSTSISADAGTIDLVSEMGSVLADDSHLAAGGNVRLRATDSPAFMSETVTLRENASVQSTGGRVDINAGDAVFIDETSTATAAGTLSIDADVPVGPPDPDPGIGGHLDLSGQLGGLTVVVSGSADLDGFRIAPSLTSAITVLGEAPELPTTPGDGLIVLTPTGETSTLTPAGPDSGTWSTSGGGTQQMFRVEESAHAEITGLTLTAGDADFGGAIENHGTLTVRQSAFTGNTSHENGGAIFNFATLTVEQSEFTGNIDDEDGGGAIADGAGYGDSTTTIIDSVFTNNQSPTDRGGALKLGGVYSISGSQFLGNIAENGGAVWATGAGTIHDSLFDGNFVVDGSGGAITSSGALTVTASTLINNHASGQNFGFGGAVDASGSFTLLDSTVADNAGHFAGGLSLFGDFLISGSAITGNRSTINGIGGIGGGLRASSNGTIVNTTLFGNTSEASGGGLYIDGTVTLRNVTVTGNHANVLGTAFQSLNGGGIHHGSPTTIALHNSIVAGNVADPGSTPSDIHGLPLEAVSSFNLVGDADSSGGVSSDGRFVVFVSQATNLVPGQIDTPGTDDVFRLDRQTGQMDLISHTGDGVTAASGSSFQPQISADGAVVVFLSEAGDLLSGFVDRNGSRADVYRWETDSVTLISAAAGSFVEGSDSENFAPIIDADGDVIVFESAASNLVAGFVDNNFDDVDLFRWESGAGVTLISGRLGSATEGANGQTDDHQLNADGSVIAFASQATDLIAGFVDNNGPGPDDLFRWAGGTVTLITGREGSATEGGNGSNFIPLVSNDGSVIAFESNASDLIPGGVDNNGATDVFRWSSGAVSLISGAEGSTTTTANGRSLTPSLSGDGTTIAFVGRATDLVPGFVGDTTSQVFRWRETSGIELISGALGSSTQSGDGASERLVISDDGNTIGFHSDAVDLIAGYQQHATGGDFFVWNDGSMFLASAQLGSTTAGALGFVDQGSVAPDGSVAFFEVDAGVTAEISDMTIRDGFVLDTTPVMVFDSFGAGILNHGTLTVMGVTFRDNSGPDGGAGVHNAGGSLHVVDSYFTNNGGNSNNTGVDGAAVSSRFGTMLEIVDTVIENNHPDSDSAVYSGSDLNVVLTNMTVRDHAYNGVEVESAGNITVTGGEIARNGVSVGSFGFGGMYLELEDAGKVTVTGIKVFDNRADAEYGGLAIYAQEDNTTAMVSDSEFTGDRADRFAGGLYVVAREVTITDTLIENNQSGLGGSLANGGGLHISQTGTAVLDNVTIRGNTAFGDGGGGLFVFDVDHLTLLDSLIESNMSGDEGGGAAISADIATVTNTQFVNNTATGVGGGLYENADLMTVVDSRFTGNTSAEGGGIFSDGILHLLNSTLWDNHAEFGGGIYVDVSVFVSNVTISGNTANLGGGLYINDDSVLRNVTVTGNRADSDDSGDGRGGGILTDYELSIYNSIVAGNFKGTGATSNDIELDSTFSDPLAADSAHNLIGDAATAAGLMDGVLGNIVGNGGGGTIDISSILNTSLADNGGPTPTHALVAGSPAINTGNNGLAFEPDGLTPLVTDQRGPGFDRILGGTVDIGAFEADSNPPPETVIIDNDDPAPAYTSSGNLGSPWTNQGFLGDLREIIGPGKSAIYTFDGLPPGEVYELSATWTALFNRETKTPFSVDGVVSGPTLIEVDQTQAPNDFADAVRIDRRTDAEIVVTQSGTNVASGISTVDLGAGIS